MWIWAAEHPRGAGTVSWTVSAALDQAAPLSQWELSEEFITLRRLLEARMGKAGKREYVQVLRLMKTFQFQEIEGAVRDALRLGAIGFDP